MFPYQVEFTPELRESDIIIRRSAEITAVLSGPVVRVPRHMDRNVDYQDPVIRNSGLVDLPFDVVSSSTARLAAVMNPKVALSYLLSTNLPLGYRVIPTLMRNLLLRRSGVNSGLSRHLANEIGRKILLEAFRLLGFNLQRKKAPSLVITHDVETERGLRKALLLKAVERKLELESMWFLPSDEYRISKSIAHDLAESSTIGSHDLRHDGKLIQIRKHEDLVRRVTESKDKLEATFEIEIKCFRSPLLQFSGRILRALSEAGYQSDFSIPCWEPAHPLTMSGFGVESVQPFEINGLMEFPLTLFQDHQVLSVLGMSVTEAVKFWTDQAGLVRSFEGDIVLLVHPDYSFSHDLLAYKELLTSLMRIHEFTAGG